MAASLLDGLGVLLLGMVLMTDGLKAVADDALRRILIRCVATALSGVGCGALVTAMVQSSTATTLTTVGFVSAGLLTFSQSVGVIFGANLGPAITGWIVSQFGFKVSLGGLSPPLVLLGGGTMAIFHFEIARGPSEEAARTAAVATVIVGEAFYLFSSRALLRPAWSVPIFSNMWLWAGIAAMMVVLLAFTHVPLLNKLFQSAPIDAMAWLWIVAIGAGVPVLVEIEKAVRRLFHSHEDV